MREQLTRVLGITVFLCLFGAGAALAQDSSGITVVSYWQCEGDQIGEAATLFQEQNSPYLNKMVDDGELASWGILTHLWGDEWNLVVYYNAEDLGTFQDSFSNFISTVMEENPETMSKWSEICHGHKDNIYSQGYFYAGDSGGEGE